VNCTIGKETVSSNESVNSEIPFQNVVITDVVGHAPSNELCAATIRHVKKKKGGAYIQIPHDPQPVNEFFHSKLFPKMYPTLFPYGIGGFEDWTRLQTVSHL
jgi:hypothetical protein